MRRRAAAAAALLLSFALSTTTLTTAHADPAPGGSALSDGVLDIVVLGDSYSAGNGAGQYYGPSDAHRSTRNYGENYADLMRSVYRVPVRVTTLAWSGKTAQDVLTTQIAQMPAQPDMVLLTAGGNDVEFSRIATDCLVTGSRGVSDCRSAVDDAHSKLPTVAQRLRDILTLVGDRMADGGQIVLLGYPLLATPEAEVIEKCSYVFWGCQSIDVSAAVRRLGREAEEVQQAAVDFFNDRSRRSDQPPATFVPVVGLYSGHEPKPALLTANPKRWINGVLETETRQEGGSPATSRYSFDKMEYYHPGITGHMREATEIIARLPDPVLLKAARRARELGYEAAAPFAGLSPVATTTPGTAVEFDASDSLAEAPDESITTYEWDFDGDGGFDESTTTPTASHTYGDVASNEARVRVTRSDGTSSIATVLVEVTVDGDTVPDAGDNCPAAANAGQDDTDGDGTGDACDSTPGIATTEAAGVYSTDSNGNLISGGSVDPASLPANTAGISLRSASDPAATDRVRIQASGLPADSEVNVWITSPATRFAVLRTDATGRLDTVVTLPPGASTLGQTVAIAVEPTLAFASAAVDSGATSAATLAATGADPGRGGIGAALLLVLGGVILAARMRTRRPVV